MQITDTQFAELLKHVPGIDIELDWDGDEGHKHVEGHEMECGKYLVFADFTVTESGKSDCGDYWTEPSFTSFGKSIFDIDFDVFDEEGEEIELTPKQDSLLTKEIERSLV